MSIDYVTENIDYLKRIKKNINIVNFVRSLNSTSGISGLSIDILNSLLDGNSFGTVAIEYSIGSTLRERDIWLILHKVLIMYAKSDNIGSIASLGLSNRVNNALLRADFYSVQDISDYISEGKTLKHIRGIGEGFAKDIEKRVRDYNICECCNYVDSNISKLYSANSKNDAINVLLKVLIEKGEKDLVDKYIELYGKKKII